MMNEQTTKALALEEQALVNFLKDEKIDQDIFQKGMIKLAAEYASLDEVRLASKMAHRTNEKYLKEVLPVQLREDREFRQAAVFLAEFLVKKELVYFGPQFDLRMPPAQA